MLRNNELKSNQKSEEPKERREEIQKTFPRNVWDERGEITNYLIGF